MPQIFRANRPTPRSIKPKQPERSSPRARGYDARWDRRSRIYREQNPFCARCMEKGRVRFNKVVDHKMPVQDGGAVHCDDAGLWGLCLSCHAWKLRLEQFARETGQMSKIVMWCDQPETRPRLV